MLKSIAVVIAALAAVAVLADYDNSDVGTPCDPLNCTTKGDCKHYMFCRKTEDYSTPNWTGIWEEDQCGEDLWFNPHLSEEHGGVCDKWENLDPETQKEYKDDPMCIPHCYFENIPEGEACTQNYIYHDWVDNQWKSTTLRCPDGLCWNNDVRTCVNE